MSPQDGSISIGKHNQLLGNQNQSSDASSSGDYLAPIKNCVDKCEAWDKLFTYKVFIVNKYNFMIDLEFENPQKVSQSPDGIDVI